MIFEIPIVPDAPEQRLTAQLDGSTYVLDLSWSDRSSSWYISVFQQRETLEPAPIVQGIRLSIGYPVLAGVQVDGRPQGELLIEDTSAQELDPGRLELGTRVRLHYFDAAELGR